MSVTTKILCPSCGHEINVENIISHQLEEKYNKEYSLKLAEVDKQQKNILAKEKEIANVVESEVNKKIKNEKNKLENQIRSQIEEENSEKFDTMKKELLRKSEQVINLNKIEADFERIKREKEELKESIEAETQKKLNSQIALEKEKIQREEKNKNELAIRELQKQLEDQKKLTEEMKRKQEQGSMQLQGEIQELAIEEWLKENFPLDTIDEIKKGDRGADCIQIVNTRTKQNCGTIYYESKRTKEFNQNWIEKFKDDIREKRANVGVLVTDALPKEQKRMKLIEGIWICSFEEFKGLCFVLRDGLIQLSSLVSSQENKGDKMIMLYDFLTSNEFRMQVEGIVEGFTQMHEDLLAEKRSILGHWKKREKQIQKVLLNTNYMYNSIKGIAGNAIQSIKTLELSEPSLAEIEF